MKIIVCLPARYGSTRLPGKPLLKINNKSIINLVYNRVQKLYNYDFKEHKLCEIIVLTEDNRIYNEVINFGGKCCIIKEECVNGTDRIIYYLKQNYSENEINNMIIVNVQGDEPFIEPTNIKIAIDNYINKLKDEKMVCSTIHYNTQDKDEILLKSRGKMVMDNDNNIIYCSRNVIPSCKKYLIIPNFDYSIHIGVFVFRPSYLLNKYFNNNTRLQLAEDIEWMKIIEQGFKINSIEVKEQECGIDTMDDYIYLLNKYKECN